MTDVPAAQAPSRDILAAYVHDAYELEKKIYAMEELEKKLRAGQKDFEAKEYALIPQKKPEQTPLKEKITPKRIISREEEESKIKKMNEEAWLKNNSIPLLFRLVTANSRKRILQEQIEAYKKEVQQKNEEAIAFNENLSFVNEKIDQENKEIIKRDHVQLTDFLDRNAKARTVYYNKCMAYQEQIKEVSTTIAQLKNARKKMYAMNILAPDYCELKHLHYIDHYFKNKLVDSVKEAVIMYRQEAFQEMVSTTLGGILASINSLTGEVRQLGMTLQKIHTEVANISQEAFQIRLLHEDMLAAAESTAKETRAQRYATEALRESNERLEFYERQRYYGYL